MFLYLIIVPSLLLFVEGQRSWHTSQIVLMKLYDLQYEHMDVVDDYLELEAKRLDELKKNLAEMFEWRSNKIIKNDIYLQNHINAMKAMKQFYLQLQKIKNLMNNTQSIEALKKIDEHKELTEDQIIVAYQALKRLQKFYAISTSDMAAGRYNGRIIGDEMNACECYVMLKYCFEEYDMYGVIDWSVETYNKWKNEGSPKCVDNEKLHFYTSSSTLHVKGFDGVTNVTSDIRSHFNKQTKKLVNYYLNIQNQLLTLDEKESEFLVSQALSNQRWDIVKFVELCKRGKSKKALTKYSKCRYETKNSFYRKLMPFKEEDINIREPLIKIYHDVIYDDEILKFKTMVLETISDSRVRSRASDKGHSMENYRLCQVAWINNSKAVGHFDSLDARIESFTGRSTISAERYQIVNYGLGGHFIPHCDSFKKGLEDEEFGNRLVTVLFYLTDVENDGYTAFPNLDIILPAEKGAALVFYNLHMSNGLEHEKSRHGACPILKGNKWITTRWLREEGQNLLYNWKMN